MTTTTTTAPCIDGAEVLAWAELRRQDLVQYVSTIFWPAGYKTEAEKQTTPLTAYVYRGQEAHGQAILNAIVKGIRTCWPNVPITVRTGDNVNDNGPILGTA